MNWLRKLWYAHMRKIDLMILWPACVRSAEGDLDRANAAFAVHVFNDEPWLILGNDEIFRILDGLRG